MTPQELAVLFRTNVLRLIEEQGISQRELAERIGRNESNVSMLLAKSTPPSGKTIAQYATAFGVDACELLCEPKRKKK